MNSEKIQVFAPIFIIVRLHLGRLINEKPKKSLILFQYPGELNFTVNVGITPEANQEGQGSGKLSNIVPA